MAGGGQGEAQLLRLAGEEGMRDLHQDAGAVTGAWIGADGAAMLQVDQNGESILDDLVRLAALDIGNEADTAGILVERGIVEAGCGGQAGVGGIGKIGRPQGAPLLLVSPIDRPAHIDAVP